jgi:hypothetical protein
MNYNTWWQRLNGNSLNTYAATRFPLKSLNVNHFHAVLEDPFQGGLYYNATNQWKSHKCRKRPIPTVFTGLE